MPTSPQQTHLNNNMHHQHPRGSNPRLTRLEPWSRQPSHPHYILHPPRTLALLTCFLSLYLSGLPFLLYALALLYLYIHLYIHINCAPFISTQSLSWTFRSLCFSSFSPSFSELRWWKPLRSIRFSRAAIRSGNFRRFDWFSLFLCDFELNRWVCDWFWMFSHIWVEFNLWRLGVLIN